MALTRCHWFTDAVAHHTRGIEEGSVNVLNLVQGDEAVIECAGGDFDPFVVHYAETFIVPAAVGAYSIRPTSGGSAPECATVKAWVR